MPHQRLGFSACIRAFQAPRSGGVRGAAGPNLSGQVQGTAIENLAFGLVTVVSAIAKRVLQHQLDLKDVRAPAKRNRSLSK